MPKHVNTDCRSKEGVTIGLIDSLISIGRVLRERIESEEMSHAIKNALADCQSDEDLNFIMGKK